MYAISVREKRKERKERKNSRMWVFRLDDFRVFCVFRGHPSIHPVLSVLI